MSEHARPNGSRPKIVVGVDGSEASVEALAWAIEEAGRRRATVEAVTVWEDPFTVVGPKPHPSIHRPTIIHLHDLQEAQSERRGPGSAVSERLPRCEASKEVATRSRCCARWPATRSSWSPGREAWARWRAPCSDR
jgi:hypothetical protein